MRYLLSSIVAVAIIMAAFSNIYASGLEDDYLNAIKVFYHVSNNDFDEVLEYSIPIEELPVAFHIAKLGKTSPAGIAKQRVAGKSWRDIAGSHNLKSDIFLAQIFGENKSKAYSSICSKLNKTPKQNWKNIRFSDEEIVNLVNLRFISSYNNYSPYEVMPMRDLGSNFVVIYKVVKTIKANTPQKKKSKNRSVAIAM